MAKRITKILAISAKKKDSKYILEILKEYWKIRTTYPGNLNKFNICYSFDDLQKSNRR